MVEDFESDNLICYLKDLNFDKEGNPILMVISSKGYQAGPQNDPRTWEVFHHTQNGWDRHKVTISDNNYDMGSIYTDSTKWRIIAPTITGPQDYNPGGEVVLWESKDQGLNWTRKKQLTVNSFKNHNYVRRPVNAHADFYGLWADGHGRQPSDSKLFFCDKEGNVFQLPETMNSNYYKYPK